MTNEITCPICGHRAPVERDDLGDVGHIQRIAEPGWQKANGRLVCGTCAPREIAKEHPLKF